MAAIKEMKGSIYVLIHPMQNKYVKIGKTTRSAQTRADELTAQAGTALAGSFIVAYEEEVENCHLVEAIIHKRFQANRVSKDREFFALSVHNAIKEIRDTIECVKKQGKFDFIDIYNPIIWWGNLPFVWRKIFKKHLALTFEPEANELIEGINNIVLYCQDQSLRIKVCDYLKNKDFQTKIQSWYGKLQKGEQQEIKTFLMRKLSEDELTQLMDLVLLDCSGNMLIHDLEAISPLKSLKNLNCRNTNLKDLTLLANHKNLEVLDISFTAITSLQPLEQLHQLKLVHCYHTDIKEDEFKRFMSIKPDCQILKNQSNKLIDI